MRKDVAIFGGMSDFEAFTGSEPQGGVLADDGPAAEGGDADFIIGADFAALGTVGDEVRPGGPCGGNGLRQGEGGAGWGVEFVAVVGFDDFAIPVCKRGGGLGTEALHDGDAEGGVGGHEDGLATGECGDSVANLLGNAGGGDEPGCTASFHLWDGRLGGLGDRKIDQEVKLRRVFQGREVAGCRFFGHSDVHTCDEFEVRSGVDEGGDGAAHAPEGTEKGYADGVCHWISSIHEMNGAHSASAASRVMGNRGERRPPGYPMGARESMALRGIGEVSLKSAKKRGNIFS